MLITLNTWFIANNRISFILVTSFCISLTWAFNVKSMSTSNWIDKIYYSLGAVCGTATALLMTKWIGN